MVHYNQQTKTYFVTKDSQIVAKNLTYTAAHLVEQNGVTKNPSNLSTMLFVLVAGSTLGTIAHFVSILF